MQTSTPLVQRYRRTDLNRAGEWQPSDSTWKTAASAGLVGHDIYHHLPGDRGTFAEEVATFGAEWYVDIQPIGKSFNSVSKRALERFERNVIDTVLNALDSRELLPFCLPIRVADRLTDEETDYFSSLATKACEELGNSTDPRALNKPAFTDRFVQCVLWGYAQAKTRFPDQLAVRAGSSELRNTLADLEQHEVPFGLEVTITLNGYTCSVTYDDADAQFLQSNKIVEARMMVWCSCAPGYPPKELSIHASESGYVEFVNEHFIREDDDTLPELQLIPRDEQSGLHKVYIRNPELQLALHDGRALKLPLEAFHAADFTPRQVPVF